MKRALIGSDAELAPVESGAQRAIAGPRARPLQPLFHQLAEAAHRGDRAAFDRVFDDCFGRVYGIAWRVTRDHARAEVITTQILCEAVFEAT